MRKLRYLVLTLIMLLIVPFPKVNAITLISKGGLIVNEDLKLLTSDIFNIEYTIDSLEEEYHVAAIKVLNGVGCYFDINGNPLINATMNSFVKTPTYEQILEGIPLVCTNNYNKGKKTRL